MRVPDDEAAAIEASLDRLIDLEDRAREAEASSAEQAPTRVSHPPEGDNGTNADGSADDAAVRDTGAAAARDTRAARDIRDIRDMSHLCRVVSRPLPPQSSRDIRDIPLIGCRGVVSRGNPIDCSLSIPCSVERVPLGDWLDAGSVERILSTDFRILNRPSPKQTVSTKTRKPSR